MFIFDCDLIREGHRTYLSAESGPTQRLAQRVFENSRWAGVCLAETEEVGSWLGR